MPYLQQPGGIVLVCDAPDFMGSGKPHLNVGVSKQAIQARSRRGLSVELGQLYGIVEPGLILTKRIFQGVKRRMHVGDDPNADKKKLTFVWTPRHDARLVGSRFEPQIERLPPPEGRVFAVYISPNLMFTEFPDIFGWAERWPWISADPEMPQAPIDWQSRYDRELWTSPGLERSDSEEKQGDN